MRTFRALPTFNGVGVSQTATLDIPIGMTLHNILLTLGGTFVPSDCSEIRVKANGRTIYTCSGDDLNTVNKFDGRVGSTSAMFLDFERYGLKTRAATEITAIGTGAPYNNNAQSPNYNPTPLNTLQLEVDIDGTPTAPTLTASASQSAPRPTGLIRHRRKFVYSPTGAGDFEIANLPKGLLIDKVYIKSASDNIVSVKLDRDNFRVFDRTAVQNDLVQSDGVRVSQSSWFVYDPTEEGNGAESLATQGVSDLRFIVNVSGADTLTAYVDYIGGFAG